MLKRMTLATITSMFLCNSAFGAQAWLFKVRRTGACLDVENYNRGENANVQSWTCGQTKENQNWVVYTDGPFWEIRNKLSNKCLTASGRSPGSNVVLRSCNGSPEQRWLKEDRGSYDVLRLKPRQNLCLDVRWLPENGDGANLVVENCDVDNSSQQFSYIRGIDF